MNYIRGNRRDFDHWEELGNTGWSYNDVLPFFIKSEKNLQIASLDKGYHGRNGYIPVSQFRYEYKFEKDFIEGATQTGQIVRDLNGASQIGFAFAQATSENGIRFSTSRAFLRPVQNRTNLHIMLETFVTRVLIDSQTNKAIGVELVRNDGSKERISSAKEVIICGGTINSPTLLLLSGIGDRQLLNDVGIPVVHHLPGVGGNLHDHVQYETVFTTNQTNFNDLNWAVAMEYLLTRDGGMSTNGNSVMGFLQTKYVNQSENWPDIKIQLKAHEARCSKTGDTDEIIGDEIDGEIPKRKVFIKSTLVQPKSRGYLTLKDSNPSPYPKLFPRYLSNHADIPPMIEGIRFIQRLVKADALKKYDLKLDETPVPGCEDLFFGSDEYWTCAIQRETNSVFHQAGTCKMGPDSDPEAVVDPQLRVKGVRGLRVADGSIMPMMVAGNSLAPIIMIAEKAADMIKTSIGSS